MPDDDTLWIQNSALQPVIILDSSANSYFALPMSLGTSGGIYQGTGTFASPTTGLKIWNDTGLGRIAGYNASVLQWYADTDGKFYAGGGAVLLDSSGIKISSTSARYGASSIDWSKTGVRKLNIGTQTDFGTVTASYIDSSIDLNINSEGAVIIASTMGGVHLLGSDGVFVNSPFSLRASGNPNGQFLVTSTVVADVYLTLPIATGTLALTSDIPTVSGTTGTIPKFTAANSIGDSIITESSSKIGINGTLKIGSGYSRSGASVDIITSDTASIGSIASGTITFNYGSAFGSEYWNEGYSFQYDIWAYRTHNGTKIFSPIALSLSGADNGGGNSGYTVDLAWDSVAEADGYLVRVYFDTYYGASNDHYFEIENNAAHISGGYIWELDTWYTYGTPATTPTTTTSTADLYATKSGDVFSTKKFFFANLPTLSVNASNGLRLRGNTNYELDIPTSSIMQIRGLNINGPVAAKAGQLIFPFGYGGSSAPGIRMVGGQTDGGLAMSDGLMEFWNNFDYYVDSPVAGRLQAVFRIDTRDGYQGEGFLIGGKLTDGTGFSALGINYGNGDINLNYYGYGATCVGTDTGTHGISAKNGWLGVKYTIKLGGGIIAGHVTQTSNYTLTENDHTVECTSGTFTLTLPSAETWKGQIYEMKNTGNGVITINTTSSQTIDGNASGVLKLSQWDNLTVQSNGSNWIIL
jgi:hypothetical protein